MPICVATTAAGVLAVFGSFDEQVHAVDASTGRAVWRYKTESRIIGGAGWDAETATVFIGSMDAHVYALDGATGALRWKFKTGAPVFSSPTITRDHVLFGSNDGHLYCLRKDDGSLVWRFLEGRTGAISSTPLVVGADRGSLVVFTSRTYQNEADSHCTGSCVGPGDLIVLRPKA